jgi:ribosome-associated translation inhibitor RaiA
MKIQFYKARDDNGGEELNVATIARLSRELNRYTDHIIRVEVHLSDDNGKTAGVNDKRCMILVEVQKLQAVSLTGHAGSYENAVNEAIIKINKSLHATYGRLRVF